MKTVQISLNSIDKVKSFVNEITKYDNDFDLVSGRYVIDAKSIMGIFSLDLSKPIDLNIHADAEREDLFQIGSIGLLKAIDKFDLTYNVKFSTYAVPLISGEIKRFLRDDGMIKVSRSLKEIAYKSVQARERLISSLGREPTIEELSEEVGVEREELVQAMEAGCEIESIYRPVHQKEGSEIRLLDKLEEKEKREDKILDLIVLKELLETLDEEEKQLIFLRYFADRTQSDVGKIMGISQVQVSRSEKRIIEKLRKKGGR